MIYSGLPLNGYRTDKDNKNAQLNNLGGLQMSILDDFLKGRTRLGDMQMFYQSEGMEDQRERYQRTQDYYLCIGSLLFMGLALWIQTHSLWIAFFSMVGSLGSFVWANLVYRIILNFFSFGDPQALAGFVIAQLGAFHVVYLTHVFRQACQIRELQTAEARLSTMVATAHRTILTTSVVMMISFFVSAASGFVVAVNFAVFCGLLSIISYLSAVFFLPAVIITWYSFWSRISCSSKQRSEDISTAQLPMSNGRTSVASLSNSASPGSSKKISKTPLYSFFTGPYVFKFVAHPVLRWLLISASAVIVAAFLIASCVQLSLNISQVCIFLCQYRVSLTCIAYSLEGCYK
jgi:predicted RND superfamily exporter protein